MSDLSDGLSEADVATLAAIQADVRKRLAAHVASAPMPNVAQMARLRDLLPATDSNEPG